ncbi:PilZ domain-containing protein [uncultured Sneathiella sp.]|uniref:PilZ domain-containing protein n=1 Tax=uncultured Sneathiella sp. TaxID=879315 RepID=UPI0030DD5094
MGRTISEQNDTGASGLDKRRYKRKTVMWNGKLSLLWGARLVGNEQTVPGVVRDLSVTGARFQTKADFRPTNEVILEVPRFGAFNCHLVWQNGRVVGLNFVDPPEFIYNTVNTALPGISLDPNPVA